MWEHVFRELIAQDVVDETALMLDSTAIKVHQRGNNDMPYCRYTA